MWKIMRSRAQKHGGMFPERAFRFLSHFGNPKKPYFIGRTSDGTQFVGDYRDLYSVLLVVDPHFNASFVNFIANRLKTKPGAYVDVGTNMGVIAAAVARAASREVIAFEPLPSAARRAAAAFALNGLTNVKLFQAAASDFDGEISFFHNPGHSDRASVHKGGTGDSHSLEQIQVLSRRLDGLTAEIGKVAFIKYDVEGHEPAAVSGSLNLIAEHKPDIIYEYSYEISPQLGWKAKDVAAAISKVAEYRFYSLKDEELQPFPTIEKEKGMVNIFGTYG